MATYTVSNDEEVDLTLCEDNDTASILQNVKLILGTRKGSIPMYRDFGLDMDFIDKPVLVARTLMAAAVKEAIETFEPRAQYVGMEFTQNESDTSKIIAKVVIEI